MDISFKNQALERLCSEQRIAKKELGHAGFKKLRARLEDLCAARVLGEVVAGKPHPLLGERKGQFALYLHGGCRLILEPAEPVPTDEHGNIVWRSVTAVCIVEIGDYHG